MAKHRFCQYCSSSLSRDEIGLSQKLFENETKRGRFTCLPCLAEQLDVTVEELLAKVEDFKSQGCRLFG